MGVVESGCEGSGRDAEWRGGEEDAVIGGFAIVSVEMVMIMSRMLGREPGRDCDRVVMWLLLPSGSI